MPRTTPDSKCIGSLNSAEYYFGLNEQKTQMPGTAEGNGSLIADAIWTLGGRKEEFNFKDVTLLASKLPMSTVQAFTNDIHYHFELLVWVHLHHPSHEPYLTALKSLDRVDTVAMAVGTADNDKAFEEYKAFRDTVGITFPEQHEDIKEAWKQLLEQAGN